MSNEIVIACKCPMCGMVTEVTCGLEQYNRYQYTSTLIQDVFPEMDIHTRETIISGMCLPCQEKFFVEEDDDEDDIPCTGNCDGCDNYDCPANIYGSYDNSCDDDCDFCQNYDCPLNTNEDN